MTLYGVELADSFVFGRALEVTEGEDGELHFSTHPGTFAALSLHEVDELASQLCDWLRKQPQAQEEKND